ncbi:hypothetical protein ACP4OV_009754 [Aristida adscensionis]
MGCFLSCFRAVPDPAGHLREPLVRESRLGEAFLDDEKKFEATRGVEEDAGDDAGVDEELRREANYLKSCGTISQTPPEIQEVSTEVSSGDGSELKDASNNENVIKGATLIEENLSEVFTSDEHDMPEHVQKSGEGTVGVESEPQSSSPDNPSSQNLENQMVDSSDSPYPTPLVLRGDIQTPGTFYTACKETLKSGKRERASRQFIYPVLRPIENKLEWMEMELRVDSPVLASNPPKRRYVSTDSCEKSQQIAASATFTQTESTKTVLFPLHDKSAEQDEGMSPEEANNQNGNEKLVEGGEVLKQDSEYGKHGGLSLSNWLKPSLADVESHSDTNGNPGKELKDACNEGSYSDVPIFAASGLDWDTDNPTPVLPKAWDGNGIPNTTTKYKEDQIVSWHATPFEERLMKVLSDEKPRHQRSGRSVGSSSTLRKMLNRELCKPQDVSSLMMNSLK